MMIRNYDQYKQARKDGVKKKHLAPSVKQGPLQAIAWEARYKAERKHSK